MISGVQTVSVHTTPTLCQRVCFSQVRGGANGQLFSLSNGGNTKTITEGISQRGSSEVVYRSFSSVPNDIYYWVLPESFRGDKVGGKQQSTEQTRVDEWGKNCEVELDISASFCPMQSCLNMFVNGKAALIHTASLL